MQFVLFSGRWVKMDIFNIIATHSMSFHDQIDHLFIGNTLKYDLILEIGTDPDTLL